MKLCEQTFWGFYCNKRAVCEDFFSQQKYPILLISDKTHVLMRFARFHHFENGRYELGPGLPPDARNCANELSMIFSQQTCSIHHIRPKTHVLMCLTWFSHCENNRCKLGLSHAPDAWNCANELSGDFFHSKCAHFILLDSKLMFWCVLCDFVTVKMAGTN